MDLLASMLAAPRARGAFVIRSDLRPPWSVRIEDGAALTLMVLTRGHAVLCRDGEPEQAMGVGEVVLVRGPRPYTVCDRAATAPQAVIGPGQACTKPDGSPLSDFRDLGMLAWGNVPDGEQPDTVLVTGTYDSGLEVSRRVLDQLPDVLILPGDGEDAEAVRAVVALLVAETRAPQAARAAQDAVVDRLVDLLLVTSLRAHFETPGRRPRWYAAQEDAVVGRALRRIHHEPHRPWSLASLAEEVGVSRATLARRFTAAVGESPMGYLARWRLDLAADLVADSDLTLAAVAARVGYASAYSLSNAFQRVHGARPSTLRPPA